MDELTISGETLGGKYKITKKLGAGRLGTVHLATDREMDRTVVVKVPHPDLVSDPGFRKRFEEGAHVLIGHAHPAVVPVLDSGTFPVVEGEVTTEVPYVVVAHMEGGSLEDRAHRGALTAEDVVVWLPKVAEALDGLHADDVLHRDIKPENLLFDENDKPHVSDFAITRALPTEAGAVLPGGSEDSYGYTPPEVLTGAPGPAHDQYSLAAVVFRCVTGRRLFPHDPYLGVWKVLSGFLSSDAASAVEKALSVEPAGRFESCGAFAKAFSVALGESEPAVPDMEATRAWTAPEIQKVEPEQAEPMSRMAKALISGAAVVLLAVVGFIALPSGSDDPEDGSASASGMPALLVTGPESGAILREAKLKVRGRVEGDGAAAVLVNETRVLPGEGGAFEASVDLEEGQNKLLVRCVDEDGRQGEPSEIEVTLDSKAPAITIRNPAEGSSLTTADWVEVKGIVEEAHLADLTLNGERLEVSETGAFSITISLREGRNRLTIQATDFAGNSASPVALTITRDGNAPLVLIESPGDGALISGGAVEVKGRVTDERLARLTVNGVDVKTAEDGSFVARVDLSAGENTIDVKAEDAAGNAAEFSRRVTQDVTAPGVVLSAPDEGLRTGDPHVVVRGRVEDDFPTHVVVNGEEFEVKLGVFAVRVALKEGENLIKVVPQDGAGNRGDPVSLTVIRDTEPPEVSAAAEPAWTTAARTVVTGTVSEDDCEVTVQGRPVSVNGRSFSAEVELSPGLTDIEVLVTDALGNRGAAHASAHMLRAGESLTAGRALATVTGDKLTVAEGGRLEIGMDPEGSETFTLTSGTVEGEIGVGTVLSLPAGRLTVPKRQRALVTVEALEYGAVHVAVEKGRVLLSSGDRMTLSLAGGQGITVRLSETDRGFSFATDEEIRGKLYVFVRLTPDLQTQLWLGGGVRGALERGLATRVISDPASPETAEFKVRTIYDMVAGAWTDVAPGTAVRVRTATAKIEPEKVE